MIGKFSVVYEQTFNMIMFLTLDYLIENFVSLVCVRILRYQFPFWLDLEGSMPRHLFILDNPIFDSSIEGSALNWYVPEHYEKILLFNRSCINFDK